MFVIVDSLALRQVCSYRSLLLAMPPLETETRPAILALAYWESMPPEDAWMWA
jgi:hypothetical protein